MSRSRLPALLALALLLCVPALPVRALSALPTPSGALGGPRVLDAPTFGSPVTLPQSSDFAEPSITTDAGHVYVVAPGSATSVWRSTTSGDSFQRVHDSLGASGDSDVAVGTDGTLYVSDLFDNVPVSVSNDAGTSFAYKTATASGNSNDRQWVAAWGTGSVFSTWRDDSGSSSVLRIAVSRDHGHTYTAHLVANHVSLEGSVVAAGADDLWVPWFDDGNGDLHVSRSTDGGATWADHVVAQGPVPNIFPALAVDAAGNAYVAWSDDKGNLLDDERIDVAASTDGGATWHGTTQLSAPGDYNVFPWIAAGAAGKVAVAWYQGQPLGVEADPNVGVLAAWTVQVAYSGDAAAATPHYVRAAATPVIHQGSLCTFGTLCAPLAASPVLSRSMLDFFELTSLSDGSIIVTYTADAGSPNLDGSTVLQVVRQNGGPNLG